MVEGLEMKGEMKGRRNSSMERESGGLEGKENTERGGRRVILLRRKKWKRVKKKGGWW